MRRTLVLILLLAGSFALGGPAAAQEVRGDFNGDGYADLAIGIPFEDVLSFEDAGAVVVLYGGPDGLEVGGDRFFQGGRYGDLEEYAMFGSALAVGYFDDDDIADLAVGAPGADRWGRDSGLVVILFGSLSGLGEEWAFSYVNARDAYYGWALATGDFDGDGTDDLAVGAPGWRHWRGAVHVRYGPDLQERRQWWWEGVEGVVGNAAAGEAFGSALAAGDFDRSGADDLAVGVPEASVRRIREGVYRGVDGAGYLLVLYGSDEGLTAEGDELFTQDSPGIGSDPEEDDGFGRNLAAGDFDRDGADDLAVGVPAEGGDFCPGFCIAGDAGVVHVLFGSDEGLTGSDSLLSRPPWDDQPTAAYGRALAVGDFDGDGADDLAVGAPGWFVEGRAVGLVRLLWGSEDDPGSRRSDFPSPGSQRAMGFGLALAAGDFDGEEGVDLAVGAPWLDVSKKHGLLVARAAGAVYVYPGEEGEGPAPGSFEEWTQGGVLFDARETESEPWDEFGRVLAP